MSFRFRFCLMLMMAVALAGCDRKQPVADVPPAYFLCGETQLKAVFHGGDQLSLSIDGVVHDLPAAIAASGAKYETSENAMPHLMFWNKGRKATLEVDGKPYPICQQIDEPVTDSEAETSSPTATPQPIKSIEWLVEDIDGRGIIDNAHLTVMFTDKGHVAGYSGCNSYGASYDLTDDGVLVIQGPIISTQRGCAAEAMMNQEQLFTQTLSVMTKAVVDGHGLLHLSNDTGQTMRLVAASVP